MTVTDTCPRCKTGPPKVPPHPWSRNAKMICPVCGFPLFVAFDAAMESPSAVLPPVAAVPLQPPVIAPTAPVPIAPPLPPAPDELLGHTSSFDWGNHPARVGWIIALSALAGILVALAVVALVLVVR